MPRQVKNKTFEMYSVAAVAAAQPQNCIKTLSLPLR